MGWRRGPRGRPRFSPVENGPIAEVEFPLPDPDSVAGTHHHYSVLYAITAACVSSTRLFLYRLARLRRALHFV